MLTVPARATGGARENIQVQQVAAASAAGLPPALEGSDQQQVSEQLWWAQSVSAIPSRMSVLNLLPECCTPLQMTASPDARSAPLHCRRQRPPSASRSTSNPATSCRPACTSAMTRNPGSQQHRQAGTEAQPAGATSTAPAAAARKPALKSATSAPGELQRPCFGRPVTSVE